jgi:hypothetical protein
VPAALPTTTASRVAGALPRTLHASSPWSISRLGPNACSLDLNPLAARA